MLLPGLKLEAPIGSTKVGSTFVEINGPGGLGPRQMLQT
jgi:hypothetical protein